MDLSTFDVVDLAILRRLVASGTPESATLDYKRDSYGSSDADKREFLRDVTAFANHRGGDLVIGIGEGDEGSLDLIGLDKTQADSEMLRLGQIIRDGIEPPLLRHRIESVDIADNRVVLHIRVSASLDAPHQVLMQDFRFYTRNSNGKHRMNSREIRDVVLRNEGWRVTAGRWVAERLALLQLGQTPVPPPRGDWRLIVHGVSLGDVHDNALNGDEARTIFLNSRRTPGKNFRRNFDGKSSPRPVVTPGRPAGTSAPGGRHAEDASDGDIGSTGGTGSEGARAPIPRRAA